MVLDFGLLHSTLFPQSSAQGEGFGSEGDTAKIENEEGELINVLSDDSVKKWALILG